MKPFKDVRFRGEGSVKNIIHKKDSESGSTGGMMGLFFINSNLCGARIPKDNQWTRDNKEVTCKDCLTKLPSAPSDKQEQKLQARMSLAQDAEERCMCGEMYCEECGRGDQEEK